MGSKSSPAKKKTVYASEQGQFSEGIEADIDRVALGATRVIYRRNERWICTIPALRGATTRVRGWNNAGTRPARRERKPPPRRWAGPLIARLPEAADAYLTRIDALAADSRTHIYFDTCFLMFLAKISEEARAEFFAWADTLGPSRFHVPLWSAHEYYKHRLNRSVASELGNEIKAFDSAAANLYQKLRIYSSDRLFGFRHGGRLFLDEYRRTIQPLRSMLKFAGQSKHLDGAVQDVATYIDAHLLPGSLSVIVADIDRDEDIRLRGVIPPAFKDRHKRGKKPAEGEAEPRKSEGDNSFGDLALWREILVHAAKVRAGAVLLLTADRKNDWFRNVDGDVGITPELRQIFGKQARPVPAPHPLLVREAFDSGAGEFNLLDPLYCGALFKRKGAASSHFIAAALDTRLPDPDAKEGGRPWARRFGAEAQMLGEFVQVELSQDEGLFNAEDLTDEMLLAPLPDEGQIADLLNAVGGDDIIARAAALGDLHLTDLGEWDGGALAMLGRLTLHAAESGDAPALDFIARFRDSAPEIADCVRQPYYFGALAALYFDAAMDPRSEGGSEAGMILLALATTGEVSAAADAVGALVAERGLAWCPGMTARLALDVIVQPSADNKSPADLVAIKLAGSDLITESQVEEPLRFAALLGEADGDIDAKLGAVIEIVTRFHLLPRQLVDVEFDLETPVHIPQFMGIELED